MTLYAFRLMHFYRKANKIFLCGMSFGIALCQMMESFINNPGFMHNYAIVSDVMVDFVNIFWIFIIALLFLYSMTFHWHMYENQKIELEHFSLAGMRKKEILTIFSMEIIFLDLVSAGIGIGIGGLLLTGMRFFLKEILKNSIYFPIFYEAEMKKVIFIVILADVLGIAVIFAKSILHTGKLKKSHIGIICLCLLSCAVIAGIVCKVNFKDILEVMILPIGIYVCFYSIILWKKAVLQKKELQHKKVLEKINKSPDLLICIRLKQEILKKDKGILNSVSALLTLFLVCIIAITISHYYWQKDVYFVTNPFDLTIVTYEEKPDISEKQISSLLIDKQNIIKKSMVLSDVRDSAYTFFSVKDVNTSLHTHYKVTPGTFTEIYRAYAGFSKKDFLSTSQIHKEMGNGNLNLKKQSEAENMLFGYSKSFADQMILLNDKDFQLLKAEGKDVYTQKVRLYEWKNWKQVEPVITKAKKIIGAQKTYEAISSKIQGFQNVKTAELFFSVTLFPLLFVQFMFGFWQYVFAIKKQQTRWKKDFEAMEILGISTKDRETFQNRLFLFDGIIPVYGCLAGLCYFGIWMELVTLIAG